MNQKAIELHKYLERQIEVCGKTQREIAAEVGYKNPNIITMFKQARTKVPLDKIGPLARALGVDPANMLKIAMLDYMPETWNAIEGIIGNVVTDNEYKLLQALKGELDEPSDDPEYRGVPSQKKALKEFVRTLE